MQAIITKYHGPTDTRGSRISATVEAGRVYISYPYELNIEEAHRKAAKALQTKLGWDKDHHADIVTGWLRPGEYVHVMTGKQS